MLALTLTLMLCQDQVLVVVLYQTMALAPTLALVLTLALTLALVSHTVHGSYQ